LIPRLDEWKSVLRAHAPQTKEILHGRLDPIVIGAGELPDSMSSTAPEPRI
jgi:hypothetical protein